MDDLEATRKVPIFAATKPSLTEWQHSQNCKIMAQEKLISIDELKVIHSVLERLDATDIEDVSGDWLSNIQMTNYEKLMFRLPEIAAKTANGELQVVIGHLSSLLYTIASYQSEIRQLSEFLNELHNARYKYYDFSDSMQPLKV